MSYFITPEQQEILDNWLDEENKAAIQMQLNDERMPEIHKKELTEAKEHGLEVPVHNQGHGYYSVSFTPTSFGTRIFAHHHITGKSFKIYDLDDASEELLKQRDEISPINDVLYQNN